MKRVKRFRELSEAIAIATIVALNVAPFGAAFAATVSSDSSSNTKSSSVQTSSSDNASAPLTLPFVNISSSNNSSSQKTASNSQVQSSQSAGVSPLSSGSGNPPTVNTPNIFSSQIQPQVNAQTGALTETIPLDIPPGRNGLQPNLALNYDSQNTDQGSEVGYGWSLSIPYIARLNKTGSQNLYGTAADFTSSLDGELEPSTITVQALVVGDA